MEQSFLTLTPKRKSIIWNYREDGNVNVMAILSDKLLTAEELNSANLGNIENGGICICLNYTGTKIWELCDGINTVEDILNTLSQEFNVEKEELVSDIDEFFKYCDSVDILDVDWRCAE